MAAPAPPKTKGGAQKRERPSDDDTFWGWSKADKAIWLRKLGRTIPFPVPTSGECITQSVWDAFADEQCAVGQVSKIVRDRMKRLFLEEGDIFRATPAQCGDGSWCLIGPEQFRFPETIVPISGRPPDTGPGEVVVRATVVVHRELAAWSDPAVFSETLLVLFWDPSKALSFDDAFVELCARGGRHVPGMRSSESLPPCCPYSVALHEDDEDESVRTLSISAVASRSPVLVRTFAAPQGLPRTEEIVFSVTMQMPIVETMRVARQAFASHGFPSPHYLLVGVNTLGWDDSRDVPLDRAVFAQPTELHLTLADLVRRVGLRDQDIGLEIHTATWPQPPRTKYRKSRAPYGFVPPEGFVVCVDALLERHDEFVAGLAEVAEALEVVRGRATDMGTSIQAHLLLIDTLMASGSRETAAATIRAKLLDAMAEALQATGEQLDAYAAMAETQCDVAARASGDGGRALREVRQHAGALQASKTMLFDTAPSDTYTTFIGRTHPRIPVPGLVVLDTGRIVYNPDAARVEKRETAKKADQCASARVSHPPVPPTSTWRRPTTRSMAK